MKKCSFTLLILTFMLINNALTGQSVFKGKVFSAENNAPLSGANVVAEGTSKATTTNEQGLFELSFDKAQPIKLIISYKGFNTFSKDFAEADFGKLQEIGLTFQILQLEEVVVSTTRSRQTLMEYPTRIDVLNNQRIKSIPALAVDEYLRSVPGVSVSRGASIFGSSTVSLRGMGSEQGRTLVLVDGVPVNKSDGGSVNWNMLSVNDVQKVEVLKGPGSSIYGGNAMGGIINMITPVPEKKFQGNISQSYGTFNTLQTMAGISGKKEKIFWGLNGMYRTSDGYVTTPADEIDEYTVPSFLDEYQLAGRFGYMFSSDQILEVSGGYYSGKRGTGQNYSDGDFTNVSEASEDGAYNTYSNTNAKVAYRKSFENGSQLNTTLYGQRENYQNIRESYRNNKITRYDVESLRDDVGFLSTYAFTIGKSHSFTTGLDLKNGAVDGQDIYVTSTDKVINRGKMFQTGIFAQDEFRIKETPWRILAGIRFDLANFYDGSFIVEDPTNETSFLQDFAGDLDDAQFNSFSPRLSLQYHIPEKYRIYGGYSRGFRPPVLDDMCRTGRISGGMKIANPDLKPEYLDNFEIGADIFGNKYVTISPSVYYSIGTDYHAYISTGDSLMMSGRMRPIRIKDNIGKVNILGAELAVNVQITENILFTAAYSRIETEIVEFKTLNAEIDDDLVGNELVYQPKDLLNCSFTWRNRIVNFFISYDYKGYQWLNETNTEKIEAYSNIDMQLWRDIYRGLSASVKVSNLLDDDYIDSRNLISPGRMVTAELRYSF